MEAIKDFQEVAKGMSEAIVPSEYRGIKIPEALRSEIQRKLVQFLDEKQVYLDPHLTLAKLSGMVGTNNAYLSSMVNNLYGCNLPTLLNRYRIAYAKRLLIEEHKKIKDVYNACGFVSRSVFYAAFTKETGFTPSIFVKQFNR